MLDATNPGDGLEVVDAFDGGDETLNPAQDNQDIENSNDDDQLFDDNGDPIDADGEGDDPAEEFEDVIRGDKTYKVPKALAAELLMQADYTRKTQEVAEIRKAAETRQAQVEKTERLQAEFAQDIAALGALNARLKPYEQVQDWPTYLRTGGAEAQAHYAEYQALNGERNAFAQTLGQKVQQRQADEQREAAKLIEDGRVELAKHIKGYGPETLSKLETFAAPFGFSPEEIREAEADPRSIRILHLAQIGHDALQARKKTQQLAQAQKTQPVQTLRGAGGRIQSRPDTDDFAAFEKLVDAKARAKR
ncbi:hypothetical protein [uncultured Brevundimonas sp.]|uniref:hypothetical protein n=1 Tax=uncultured Brevundimonas sp. TaxID=213418 RepID=UPI0026022193|nr:hypothetical protein [uncultured Brevundimonas sp.]